MKTENNPILLGKYLEIVGSIGFGGFSGLVVNPILSEQKGERVLSRDVSAVVGYVVRNNMDSSTPNGPITFEIPSLSWVLVDGTYVPKSITQRLHPGKQVVLEKTVFIRWMLCNRNYLGLTLYNAVIKRSSKEYNLHIRFPNKVTFTLEEAEYFTLAMSARCAVSLHSPEFKRQCATQVQGRWRVKPEFVDLFGFLNNPSMSIHKWKPPVRVQGRLMKSNRHVGYVVFMGGEYKHLSIQETRDVVELSSDTNVKIDKNGCIRARTNTGALRDTHIR